MTSTSESSDFVLWREVLIAYVAPALSAGVGGLAAALLAHLLATVPLFPDRIRIDFPIAAVLAATISTWRWCSTHRKADT